MLYIVDQVILMATPIVEIRYLPRVIDRVYLYMENRYFIPIFKHYIYGCGIGWCYSRSTAQ